jgi:hypothetical protein
MDNMQHVICRVPLRNKMRIGRKHGPGLAGWHHDRDGRPAVSHHSSKPKPIHRTGHVDIRDDEAHVAPGF